MSNFMIDIAALNLDDLGRVSLSDDLLESLQGCEDIISAGMGSNWVVCTGANAGSCSNNLCTGTTNASCTNWGQCIGATNNRCATQNEVPGD